MSGPSNVQSGSGITFLDAGELSLVAAGDKANNAIRVNLVAGAGSGGTASNFGAPFPAAGTAAGFKDTLGNMSAGNLDGSGNLLVNVAAGGSGGGAVTIADGADVTQGAIADAAVTTDVNSTMSGKLRGLVKMFSDVWDSANHWFRVNVQNTVAAVVSGTVAVSGIGAAVTVDQGGAPWAENITQIGGSAVVTGTGLSGAGIPRVTVSSDSVVGLAAGTQVIGHVIVDSGTVNVNQGTANATPWNENVAQVGGSPVSLGQKLMASSLPVTIASDQGNLPVAEVRPANSAQSEIFPTPGNNVILQPNAGRRGGRIRNLTNRPMKLREGTPATEHLFTEVVAPGTSFDIEFPSYTGEFDAYFDTAPYGVVEVTERS